jgi:hypothetical protein
MRKMFAIATTKSTIQVTRVIILYASTIHANWIESTISLGMPIILSLFAPIQKSAYLYLERVLKFHQSSFELQCLFRRVLLQL